MNWETLVAAYIAGAALVLSREWLILTSIILITVILMLAVFWLLIWFFEFCQGGHVNKRGKA